MKSIFISAFIFFLFFSTTHSCADEVDDIIKTIEKNLNGNTAFMHITMEVKTKRSQRRMEMESYSVGNDKSFIKILYPEKDYGITFLKRDNAMWQYVPRIEKIIKIPASMMLQSWMGSDFSNDDLVKESSLSKDYHSRLLENNSKTYIIELIPNDDAPVVWGKINITIDKQFFLPTTVNYFDEDNVLVRILRYQKVEKRGNRFYPTRWVMDPQGKEKKGHQTIITINNATFDKEIDGKYFTKRALKRYSR